MSRTDDEMLKQKQQMVGLLRVVNAMARMHYDTEQDPEVLAELRAAAAACKKAGCEVQLAPQLVLLSREVDGVAREISKAEAVEMTLKVFGNDARYVGRKHLINTARTLMGQPPIDYAPVRGRWQDFV